MPDEDTELLLAQAARGDAHAKGVLLGRHRERLLRMISIRMDHRIRRRVDPSDLVQEILVEADHRLEAYLKTRPIPFYPWLRQLAWDRIVTYHRRHLYAARRSRRREEEIVPALSDASANDLASSLIDDSTAPLNRLVRQELRDRVRRAIEQLPETYREILVLRYLEQLSMTEAAAVLSIGQSAAKMRHLRAVERLREALDGGEGSAGL